MRLTHVKLAGFKSFVDPTTIATPGQLIGIVGPNGCGKSNVIDAVRWVLGESSAKQLRGENMADVIFAGSADRKPLGRASVELVFDNTAGRLAGPWAQYAEISVKRVVTREGDSSYYINSQHVRRKDVTDLFLGTGLGPRSYAIIEQGTISRMITAKPEELRLFLEEAAGVSKYRDRRKETQSRLEDTRENLARVADILSELDKQLTKLAEQAEVAAKYNEFNNELKETQNLFIFTKAREAGQSKERYASEITKIQVGIEEEMAKLRETERLLNELRESQFDEVEKMQGLQGAMFEANAAVSQLQQELRFLTENRARMTEQVEKMADEAARIGLQMAQSQTDQSHWTNELSLSAERIEIAKLTVEEKHQLIPAAEQAFAAAQENARKAEVSLREAEQAQRMDEMREGQALKNIAAFEGRRNRLKTEMMALPTPDPEEIAQIEMQHEEVLEQLTILQDEEHSLDVKLPTLERERQSEQTQIGDLQREIARMEASLMALEKQQAKSEANNQVAIWAGKHGIADAKKLWQHIKVQAGWEDAVEAALGGALAATHLTSTSKLSEITQDSPPGSFTAYVAGEAGLRGSNNGFAPLADKVNSDDPATRAFVSDILAHYYSLPDGLHVEAALSKARELPAGSVLVSANGHRYTRMGVSFYGPDDGNKDLHGVLARSREIEALKLDIPSKQESRHALEESMTKRAQEIETLRNRMKAIRAEIGEKQGKERNYEVELARLKQNLAVAEGRRNTIKQELAQIEQEESIEQEAMKLAQEALTQSAVGMDGIVVTLDDADKAVRQAQAALNDARNAAQQAERSLQESHFAERSCRDKITSIATLAASLGERLSAITNEQTSMRSQLGEMSEAHLREQLNSSLLKLDERKKILEEAKRGNEELEHTLRSKDEERLRAEQAIAPLNQKLADLRFKEQEARINEETFRGQLTEAQADYDALAELIQKKQRSAGFQAEINRLQTAITELGAVNMAALQELDASKQRKDFLDAQANDLNQAVETLENAIRKIDKETRDLLQNTFDIVNANLKELFPAIFRGGQAYLKLTGDEILNAGVEVVAQPPGKKNQSIQLLSGGEKALTAIALVFSLFRLNPAPFCMLDEVDAPLDDSNTGRMADLVRRMSEHTQFLFITHNKITMELASQLVGVTMQEPGVSRIVEVDVGQAFEFSQVAAKGAPAAKTEPAAA